MRCVRRSKARRRHPSVCIRSALPLERSRGGSWSPAGRYLTERPSFTLDPAFHAGAYYVQEASSQFLAHVLAGEEVAGKRILDLCAAPGKDDALCVARG